MLRRKKSSPFNDVLIFTIKILNRMKKEDLVAFFTYLKMIKSIKIK